MAKRVYLSGKISGEPREAVWLKFRNAEREILRQGDTPVSPLDNGLPPDAPWQQHMRADITLLLTCDEVLALPDWRYSPGATIEIRLAENLQIPIRYL